MSRLDEHEKELWLTGKYAGLGEILMVSTLLFVLHKTGMMDILMEPPTWTVVLMFVAGLYCVWRGHKHH